jgi:hypothetical protein
MIIIYKPPHRVDSGDLSQYHNPLTEMRFDNSRSRPGATTSASEFTGQYAFSTRELIVLKFLGGMHEEIVPPAERPQWSDPNHNCRMSYPSDSLYFGGAAVSILPDNRDTALASNSETS